MNARKFNLTAAALVLLNGGTLLAQPSAPAPDAKNPPDPKSQPADSMSTERAASDRSPRLIPSEWAIGQKVLDSDRRRLGKVKDLILDAADGHVVYALINRAPTDDASPAIVAVPWLALTWDGGERVLVLPMTKGKLADASTFNMKRWDLLDDKTWADDICGFYGVDRDAYSSGWHLDAADADHPAAPERDNKSPKQPAREGGDADRSTKNGNPSGNPAAESYAVNPRHFVLASKVKGQTLRGAEDKEIGDVDELVFDGPSGRMAFIVAEFGGFLGIGDSKVAVPWDYFRVNDEGHLYTNDVKADEVRTAPRLDKADWSELRDPGFGPRVYQHFGRDDKWFETGFGAPASKELGSADSYKSLYAAGTASEVSGTVKRIAEDEPFRGAGTVQTVVIETDSGDRLVDLAPASYLQDKGCTIKQGDRVTINGHAATVNGRQVLIASSVKGPDGKTVDLRDGHGDPRWAATR